MPAPSPPTGDSLWARLSLPSCSGFLPCVEMVGPTSLRWSLVWAEDRLHFCAKKKTGAHYLVVEAPGEERVLMAIDPKLGAAARKFALKVDYLAGTQGVYAS